MSDQNSKKITMRISAVSIVCNVLLTTFKLIAGIVANSSALVADAVHSASDVLGSFIVMMGAVISHKSADASHPYGHEKLECIASILLGNILFIVGCVIGYNGISKIVSGADIAVPGSLALIAAAVSIVVKEALYWYTIIGARKINSISLKAEAWHHRSDALSSIGSFAGVLGARLGYPIMDPIAAIVICLFILKVSLDIFKESIERLDDHSCDIVETDKMVEAIKAVPGVMGVDDIKTRLFGSRTYVDVEIRADGEQKLSDAHAIAEAAHHKLEEEFPDVKHCTVHVNPTVKKDEEQDTKNTAP
jgi:cation diffusion facilitator family transporter